MAMHACTVLSALALALLACGNPDAPPLPATSIELLRPVPEVVTPGQRLPDIVAVRVVDADGEGRPDVPVVWGVEAGGGQLLETRSATGPGGVATTRWVLGPWPGRQQLAVSVPGESALRVAADGRAFRATRMDAGSGYVCGIITHELWCAGNAIDWAAGPASPGREREPKRLLPGMQVRDFAAGDVNICALELSGQPVCFPLYGFEPSGQPPLGRPPVPPLRSISSGDEYFCGIAAADSTAWCWSTSWGSAEAEDVHQVPGFLRLVSVTAGGDPRFACGLDAAAAAWCWRAPPDSAPTTPRRVEGVAFRTFSAGRSFACGATEERTLVCVEDPGSPVPRRLPGYRAETVACSYSCIIALGTDVIRASPTPAGVAAPMTVGFPVVAVSADDTSCIQGAGLDIYCDSQVGVVPEIEGGSQWFFAVPRLSP